MAEFNYRLAQFTRNHEFIQEHNASEANFKAGHNKFSDWTEKEYKDILTYDASAERMEPTTIEGVAQPVDWRAEGAVNEVQDQGQCGSCWTFSTMASFEGAHFLASGNLEKYAEQQLVDCDRGLLTPNNGCNG